MLEKCFGNDTLTRSNVFRWHELFRSGRESVEDDERSGRPSTAKTDENVNKIKGWMTVGRKLIIREIAEELNIAYVYLYETAQLTLSKLKYIEREG